VRASVLIGWGQRPKIGPQKAKKSERSVRAPTSVSTVRGDSYCKHTTDLKRP
jgi:hypothetical protein